MVGSSQHRAAWSSRTGFIFAAIGSAVGLGNFWRFPYTAGENGGGAFVLVYVICVLFIALPLVMSELLIGRRGKMSAVAGTRAVAKEANQGTWWSAIGWLGIATGTLILTFYSVIGGWVIAYILKALTGSFAGASADQIGDMFNTLLADPLQLIFYHTLFIALTAFIVMRGLKGGIEAAVTILMPTLFLMMVGMAIYAAFTGAFVEAVEFLLVPDFSKINSDVVLDAIGQAFFSVGVGAAIMLTYGSYLPKEVNLSESAFVISIADTGVAILAGMLIFPIVFQYGLDPAAGPGLVFVTLPIAFAQMFGGVIIAALFFILLLVAAITSSISLFEISVAWGEEEHGMSRTVSAIIFAGLIWFVGLGTVFSFNNWAGFYPFGGIELFAEMTVFDMIDYITGNIMLLTGGVMIAVFTGWAMSRQATLDELGLSDGFLFSAWLILVRFVAPLAIGFILLSNIANIIGLSLS